MKTMPLGSRLLLTYAAMGLGAWMLHRAYREGVDLATWIGVALVVAVIWIAPWLYFSGEYPRTGRLLGAVFFALLALGFAWLTLGPAAGSHAPSGFRDHAALATMLGLPLGISAWCFRKWLASGKPAQAAAGVAHPAARASGWHRHRKRGRAH